MSKSLSFFLSVFALSLQTPQFLSSHHQSLQYGLQTTPEAPYPPLPIFSLFQPLPNLVVSRCTARIDTTPPTTMNTINTIPIKLSPGALDSLQYSYCASRSIQQAQCSVHVNTVDWQQLSDKITSLYDSSLGHSRSR